LPDGEEECYTTPKDVTQKNKKDEKEKVKKPKVYGRDRRVFQMTCELLSPVAASNPTGLPNVDLTDEKGRKQIDTYAFPRGQDGKPTIPSNWTAALLDKTATKDIWRQAEQLNKTGIKTTLKPQQITEIFEKLRLSGFQVHRFVFYGPKILGDALPSVRTYVTAINQKGKERSAIYKAETFDDGTQFTQYLLMPKQFEKHVLTLFELGGSLQGIGAAALRRKGLGRFKVLSLKEVD